MDGAVNSNGTLTLTRPALPKVKGKMDVIVA